jgi:hypothetical protein
MMNPLARIGMLFAITLFAALLLAGLASPFASRQPDGLERVALDTGFADHQRESATADSPVADYSVAGIEHAKWATGLSGALGVLVTLAVAAALFGGILFTRRRRVRDATRRSTT